jgi:integrase
VEKLIAASPPGVASILRLLEQTGMREMEAVTLSASDVDRSSKQIRLIRTKTNRPRTLDWRTPGGDAGIVLDATVPPFLNAYGRPYRNFASNVNQITRRLMAEDPAFKPFRVHDLRHRSRSGGCAMAAISIICHCISGTLRFVRPGDISGTSRRGSRRPHRGEMHIEKRLELRHMTSELNRQDEGRQYP